MSMRVECKHCSTFLLSNHQGEFVHHRSTKSCDKPEPDFPEDPALAGLPVQWVWEGGSLRAATAADQLPGA